MIRVAVLMACFNRIEKTIECLDKLFSQIGLGDQFIIEVFLVDDASTDGTGRILKERFPSVRIIVGNGTLYWNRGMHEAWKAAAVTPPDVYLWLNNDSYLYEDALQVMLSASQKFNDKAIICGCFESPVKSGELTYGGGRLIKGAYVSNYPDGKIELCDLMNGNCVLVPQEVFEIVGNLDRKFVHAIGDNDYSLRAQKLGVSTYTTGDFIGVCARNATLPKWCLKTVGLFERIKSLYSPLGNSHPKYYFIYEKRHFGLITAFKHIITIHIRVLIPSLWK